MRVMVMMRANKQTEAGLMPSEQAFKEMGEYNEALVNAGIMLAGEGLHPSTKGKRISFSAGGNSVVDGPFAEAKELIAGFWMWKVGSMEEAVEWARRCPNTDGDEFEIELRPVFEPEDFGPEFTPELRAQEDRLREELERQRR